MFGWWICVSVMVLIIWLWYIVLCLIIVSLVLRKLKLNLVLWVISGEFVMNLSKFLISLGKCGLLVRKVVESLCIVLVVVGML